MRATFAKPDLPVEREDWLKIDGILCKEYKYKPWELDELTITECGWLLLALKEDDDDKPLKLTAGQDPTTQRIVRDQMDKEVQKRIAYQRLPAKEKLERAMKQYPV